MKFIRPRIQLRCVRGKGGDETLHGYLFQDSEYASKWLNKSHVKERYSVAIVLAGRTRYGEERIAKVCKKLSVEKFLKLGNKWFDLAI